MPYIINPDGSVTVLELEYDSNGTSRPRRSYEEYRSQEIKSGTTGKSIEKSSTNSSPIKNKPRKKTVVPKMGAKASVPYNKPKVKAKKITSTQRITAANIEPTLMGIDAFFTKLEEKGQMVSDKILNDAKGQLPPILCRYLQRRYNRHLQILKARRKFERNNQNFRKAKKDKVRPKPTAQHASNTRNGFTLADIAIVKHQTLEPDSTPNWSSKSPRGGHKPKYGYARDYFGRVQERDILDEERGNEFVQGKKRQSYYDYSSFDENDDHDGAYSSWD